MHSYCKNWVLLLNRWPFNVKCFGGDKNNIYPKAVLLQNGTKIQKKRFNSRKKLPCTYSFIFALFFIFRALSKIRYVILNLGRVMQSFTGSYLIGSLFERWIIKIWMNSLCTEGRHRITLFLLSKKIFWNSCLRYLSFSFIRPTFQTLKWYVHNSE